MVQLGFVLDQSRCIGCHACTVACKAENEVPVGSFRTWVKYTETGEFPDVRRSFAVLRCNQCTDAPCMTICPTTALHKLENGIVDLDRDVCIGCKSCMQACPYDALYLNPDSGTAEKCHFCAHRVESGLAPACAVVCPTEAIVPGDFDDPLSVVSRMRDENELVRRKLEAGTGPNVMYRDVDPCGVRPEQASLAHGSIWSHVPEGSRLDAHRFEEELAEAEKAAREASARTVYDVDHAPMWGGRVTTYLFTKSLAAGAFLAGMPLLLMEAPTRAATLAVPLLAILFLLVTTALLIADLKRPDRFLLILKRPNWDSWLVKGTVVLIAYGLLLTVWLGIAALGGDTRGPAAGLLGTATNILAMGAACYTAFLFGQARGRVRWMQRLLWLQLVFQALVAGGGLMLVLHSLLDPDTGALNGMRGLLAVGLLGNLGFLLSAGRLAPRGREAEYHRVERLITHGPYAMRHWIWGVGLGIAVPLVLLTVPTPLGLAAAGLLALVGLFVEEDILVRAGQALPIS
jgi:Fe-S-cluster-containing dehydrogenase component/formate-dependent nitrite reductase membrane component NrfD